MRVYRIEHKEHGGGPWCPPQDGSEECIADRYDDVKDDTVPSCYEGPCGHDDCSTYGDQCQYEAFAGVSVHGCVNLTQLEQWFQCPHGREMMEAYGYTGVIYEVDRAFVRFGSSQVMFKLAKAERVGSFDLVTLTEMEHA
jgi:hypothetical protein